MNVELAHAGGVEDGEKVEGHTDRPWDISTRRRLNI
jgi:hypothetical protein